MRRKGLRFAVALIAVATALGLFHVWIQLRVIHLAYALAHEQQALEEAEEASRKLRAEVAFLKSAGRLERFAHDRLGMTSLDPGAIRVVRAPRRDPAGAGSP